MTSDALPLAVRSRLEHLCERYALNGSAVSALAAVLAAIAFDPHAPTTINAPAEALDVHIADSLVALGLDEIRDVEVIADLGSGAGIPGLVLAIALPDASVSLVESTHRKAAFIGRTIVAAGIRNASPVCARAEGWPDGIGAHDLVTARALAPLNVVAEYAAPLLRVGGHLVAWSGKRDPVIEADATRAAEILGLSPPRAIRVQPFARAEHRHLHCMTKLDATPSAYPRRAGMARKRPLGVATAPSDRAYR